MKLIKILSFAYYLVESKRGSSGKSRGSSTSGGHSDINPTDNRSPLYGVVGVGMAVIGSLITLNDVYEILSSFKPKTVLKKVSKNDCRVDAAESEKTCYHICVKTSNKSYAGTDKNVGLKL